MVTSIHQAYWVGVGFGLAFGIILGWMMSLIPVRRKRREDRDTEEIDRILAFQETPPRTMDEIAEDRTVAPGPRHARPGPDPMEERYQELVWKRSGRHAIPVVASLTTSSYGPGANWPVPWHGSTMVIGKPSTHVMNGRGSSTLVGSGMRLSVGTLAEMT